MNDNKNLTDKKLIENVITGEPEASDLLVDRFANFVWSVLVRDLGLPRDVAEDLHQELFYRLLDNGCHRLRIWSGEGTFASYLGPIVRNLANDHFRKASTRRETPIDDGDDDPDGPRPGQVLVCEDPGPEEMADAAERRHRLHASLAMLSERDRLILRLRHLEERSYREIAERTGYRISSVGVIISRAEKRLRERILSESLPLPRPVPHEDETRSTRRDRRLPRP